MKLVLSNYQLEIYFSKTPEAIRREKARKIDALSMKYRVSTERNALGEPYVVSVLISRIKAARELYGFGLKEAKEWVEDAFENGGRGKVK